MDRFYRHMRRRTGILMDGPRPRSGRWSFAAANRKAYRGDPPLPSLPTPSPMRQSGNGCWRP